jgi:hypothetical protein
MATTRMLLMTLAVLCSSTLEADEPARPQISLDGQWQFKLDPNDEGVARRWYATEVNFPDTISVPGNWQSQGFGEPRNHLSHDYQGKAWYRRFVTIPADWAGKRFWLHLGGVTALGEVYVNEKHVGSVDHYLTPYEFDVTDFVRVGTENVISCQVDSRSGCHDPHRDPIVRPGPVGMFNFWAHWGGLYRPVYLEARSNPAIDTLFVTSNIEQGLALAKVVLTRSAPGRAWDGELTVSITPVSGGSTSTAEGSVHFGEGQLASEEAVVSVAVKDAKLWSPEDPFLYHVEAAVLENGVPIDTKRDRFGMREIVAGKGGTLLLNGRPYFIRGLGDDYVEPITGTLVPDKNVYLERIQLCKRYGFNGFRYLGHTPSREVFDAADEAGFLILAEAPAYWNMWPRQDEIIPLYKTMVAQIIREHHNHPSWYAWSAGNEFSSNSPWMDYILYAHDTFQKMDPTRFFIGSEGTGIFPMDIVTAANMFVPDQGGGAIDQSFHGLVSEVAYFKQSLSDADLSKLAKPGSGYAEMVRSLKPSGYWRLNETAVGNVSDSSGNGLNGLCEESVSRDNLGQPGVLLASDSGGSMRFGAGVPALSLESVAKTAFAAGNQSFSLSIWVKPDQFAKGDYGTPFACGTASPGSAFLLSMDGEEGTGKVLIGLWLSNVAKSTLSLRVGEWNHVGATYDGEKLKLFINGQADTSTTVRLMTEPLDGRIGNLIRKASDFNRIQNLPHIWHEFNNVYAGSLPDLTIAPKYTGIIRDNNCVAFHVQEIADYGLTQRYNDIRKRSLDFFHLYLKDAYETARKSPTLDGYNYWLMTDLPGGVEGDPSCLGLLNMFYEPEKFPDPKPFLRFNGETVILVSAPADDRILSAGERKPIAISVSHYGKEPVNKGRLVWKLKHGSTVIEEGAVDGINIAVGEVKEVATLGCSPGTFDHAVKLTLEARLIASACEQDNEWNFWAFPDKKRDFTGSGIANRTDTAVLNERYGADSAAPLDKSRVVITDKMDAAVLDYVCGGGTVVLLTEAGVLQHSVSITFWPQGLRSVGSVVEDHPAVNEFPNDGYCAFQFLRLFGTSVEAFDLTTKDSLERARFSSVIWGLKADFDSSSEFQWPDPRARTKLSRCGLVCEGRIGRGKLLTCSLRVLSGIQSGLPEAGYLMDCLVDHALSETFAPASEPLTVEEAKRVFKIPPPVVP